LIGVTSECKYKQLDASRLLIEGLCRLGIVRATLVPLLNELRIDEHIPLIARNHAERILKKIEK